MADEINCWFSNTNLKVISILCPKGSSWETQYHFYIVLTSIFSLNNGIGQKKMFYIRLLFFIIKINGTIA